MNKILFALVLMALASPAMAGDHHSTNSNIFSDFHLDENAENTCSDGLDACDYSGQATNNITNTGADWVAGFNNSAYDYVRANSDYGTIVDEIEWDLFDTANFPNGFTIMFWTNPDTNGVEKSFPFWKATGTAFNRWNINRIAGTDTAFEFDVLDAGTSQSAKASTGAVTDGAWSHIAFVGTVDWIESYVNATAKTNSTLIGITSFNNADPVRIGSRWVAGVPSRHYDGILDEIRIFNGTLNTSELQREMALGFAGMSPNTPPDVIIFEPQNITYFNSTIPVNVTANDTDDEPYNCSIIHDGVYIWNETNMTSNQTDLTETDIGSHNFTVTCTDGIATNTSTVLYTLGSWQFWVDSSFDGSFVQNFTLLFNNGTDSSFHTITTSNLTILPENLPQGNNNITVTATGFGTETFTNFNINQTQTLNHTFTLDPASITINYIDEITGGVIGNPLVITIANSTQTFIDGALNKFESFNAGDNITFAPRVCDRNLNTFSREIGQAPDPDFECWISLPKTTENNTIFYKYQREDAGGSIDMLLEFYLFNTNTNQWDLVQNTTVVDANVSLNINSFQINNSNQFYNGRIRLNTSYDTGTYLDMYEIYTEQLSNSQYDFTEVPNGIPSTVTAKDIDAFFQFPLRTFFVTINSATATTLNAYLIKLIDSVTASFAVVSTFEVPIGNVTVTAQRDFGSGFVTVSQGLTDDSGLTSMPLDPTYTYRMIFTTAQGETITQNLRPEQGITKLVRFPTSAETNFTNIFDDINYLFRPFETGLSSTQGNTNFSFEIVSINSELTNFFMNISNNGTLIFNQTVTGSPSGGTISAIVNVSNYTGNLTVTAVFVKLNETQNLFQIYQIYNVTEGNYTLNRFFERLDSNEFGITTFEKSMMGVVSLAFVMGGVAILGVGMELAGLAGLLVLIVLGIANIFSWGLITVTGIFLLAVMLLKWRVS